MAIAQSTVMHHTDFILSNISRPLSGRASKHEGRLENLGQQWSSTSSDWRCQCFREWSGSAPNGPRDWPQLLHSSFPRSRNPSLLRKRSSSPIS